MFNNFAQKEINRDNSLKALDLYRGLTLATLLETLESNTTLFTTTSKCATYTTSFHRR
jgi:hypothetical protein